MTILHRVADEELKVLVACSQSLVSAGYRALLETGSGIAVAGEAHYGQEAVELARQLRPDAVLMDIEISDCGCVEATSRLCAYPCRCSS